jgi:hypothetical protein
MDQAATNLQRVERAWEVWTREPVTMERYTRPEDAFADAGIPLPATIDGWETR